MRELQFPLPTEGGCIQLQNGYCACRPQAWLWSNLLADIALWSPSQPASVSAQAQDDLTNAFQDLKALEFATEQQAKRLGEIEARRAQSRMDEMALVRHLRKHALRSV